MLARPFTNANTPMGPFSELIAYPGLSKGVGEITTQTQLWGAEANLRRVLIGNANAGGFELDAIVGYRYLELDEHLTDTEYFFRTPGSNMSIGTPAMSGSVYDSFHTTDVFHGGQIGLNASYTARSMVDLMAGPLVAFGDLEQSAYINGNQTLYFANGTVTHTTGGLLGLPNANIGTFHNSQFAVIPEVTLNVGYQITSHWRVFVGYDFLFLGNSRCGRAARSTPPSMRPDPELPSAGQSSAVAGRIPAPRTLLHHERLLRTGHQLGGFSSAGNVIGKPDASAKDSHLGPSLTLCRFGRMPFRFNRAGPFVRRADSTAT